MIAIKLLKITDREHEELDEFFEETDRIELDQVAPQVVDGDTNVKVGDKAIADYDACFAEIPPKNAVFGRVMLEMIEEKNVKSKPVFDCLLHNGKEKLSLLYTTRKDIPTPKTAIIATEKAARNIEKSWKHL